MLVRLGELSELYDVVDTCALNDEHRLQSSLSSAHCSPRLID